MPIYEYECPECGRRVERIESFSSDSRILCEHGDRDVPPTQMRRLVSVPSRAHFKGSGFYDTDYREKLD